MDLRYINYSILIYECQSIHDVSHETFSKFRKRFTWNICLEDKSVSRETLYKER